MSSRYQKALEILNSLQMSGQKVRAENKIPNTLHLLDSVGVDKNLLNSLKYVHVAGTKGKGSTCAFTESILRKCGLKTGFCSSPHLVEVRERIKINGDCLPYSSFADYFMDFCAKFPDSTIRQLGYAQLMTMLAFYVFLEESVDVAILEVGIGGRYDFTNIIERSNVCGVTLLDYDHCHILGNSIREIAYQKAGIFKPQIPLFTVKQFYEEAEDELFRCASHLGCALQVVPLSRDVRNCLSAGFGDDFMAINASLAVRLAQAITGEEGTKLSYQFSEGLRDCFWPGRFQIIRRKSHSFFLDGAHTILSIKAVEQSYQKHLAQIKNDVKKVLIVWLSGGRNPELLLEPLTNIDFDLVVFTCPFSDENSLDVQSFNLNHSIMEEKTAYFRDSWINLMGCKKSLKCVNQVNDFTFDGDEQMVGSSPSLLKTITLIESLPHDTPCHIVVTGSLYLVGAFIKYLNKK